MQAKIKKLVFEVQFDNESSPYNGKHFSQSYLKRFIVFRQSIIQNLKDYITVDVVPKQPPRYYTPLQVPGNNNLYHDLKHNKLVHFPRKGSFEVTIDNFLVFSRLQTGKWPDTESLTEWAFKVAEKMLDVEIEKERPVIQNSKLQIYSRREQISTRQRPSQDSRQRRRKSVNRSFVQQKLPRIGHNLDQRSSIVSNFTTMPVRPPSKQSNFTPQNKNDRQDLPSTFNKKDFQKTQRIFRYSNNKQQAIKQRVSEQRKHAYFSDSKSRSKHQSFHWNLGTPLNFSVDKADTSNEDLFRETVYRNKKVELEPLRKEIVLESDKNPLDSHKSNKQFQDRLEKIELRISQSHLNTFRGLYQVQGNLITKKKEEIKWAPILCQNVLPLKGQYYFTVAVIHSVQNQIKIGIVPLNYYPDALQKEERRDQFFIGYDCSNGMIRDSKLDEQSQATSWRLGGDSAPQKKTFQIRVTIDMDTNYIDWYIEQDIVASSKISRSFSQGFRVILNIANMNDCVLLNEQNWRAKIKQEEGKFYLQEDNKKLQTEMQLKKQNQNVQEKQEIHKEGELTIDQGIQTSFVGTIKKQRVTKFIQRKRNASVLKDQSVLEQQLLHQYNNRRLQQKLNYQSNEHKQQINEHKHFNTENQAKKDSKQIENNQTKIEIKEQAQIVQIQSKSNSPQIKKQNQILVKKQKQNGETLSAQTVQNIQKKTQEKAQTNQIVIPQTQHKEKTKLQNKQSQNTTSGNILLPKLEESNKPLSNQMSQPENPAKQNQKAQNPLKYKQQVPLSQGTDKLQEPLKTQAPPNKVVEGSLQPKQQIVKNVDKTQNVVHEQEQKMEWVACFQENSFKIKQKVPKG